MPQNRLQILLGLFLLVPFFAATAQNSSPAAPPSCSAPQFRQLDFRVGEWDLTWPGSKPDEVQHGRNTIRKILDDCVIQEQFDGGAAAPLRGMSVSIYNPGLKEWQQTWVDNQAAYLDFTGEFADGEMVLSRHARNAKGDDIVQRMVFKNIKPDALDWSWEQSSDAGKTWTVVWPIHYVRHKS